MDELFYNISRFSPDCVLITESWLQPSIPNDSLKISGYSLHRADRFSGLKGGGICAWIKCEFHVDVIINRSSINDLEYLFLRISRSNTSFLLLIVYFPHGQTMNANLKSQCFDHLTNIIDSAMENYRNCQLFVMGDFNRVSSSVLENNFSLENIVHVPTRKDAILDLMLIPESLKLDYSIPTVLDPLGSSDHAVLYLASSNPAPVDNVYKKVFDLRASNISPIGQLLQSIDFESLFSDLELNQMCSLFYDILNDSLSSLPFNIIRCSPNDKPWMTATIKVLINKRFLAYRSGNWVLYKHFREKVKTAIYNAKRTWATRAKQDGSSIWHIRNNVIGTSKDRNWLSKCAQNTPIPEILSDLSDKYASVMSIDPIPQTSSPFIVPFNFTVDQVEKLLSEIDTKKSPGSDGIPTIIWVKLSRALAYPLCSLFNKCLESADLPILWKQADIVPLPKTDRPTLSNTRPISLLPMPARILERHIMRWFSSEFSKHGDHNQFAYKKQSSTTCALIHLTNFIATSLSRNDVVACHLVALDIEKGFDRVSHNLLVQKMIRDNFDPFLIKFVSNYLLDRSQRVRWRFQFSNFRGITSGVPQGSSIGPVLFSYFLSDMTIDNDICIMKYADDIFLCGAVTKNYSSSPLQLSYQQVGDWMDRNKMSVRTDKCKQISITLRTRNIESGWEFEDIPIVDNLKILGIIFDKRLNWKSHCEMISKKSSSRLYVLRQLKPFLNKNELFRIYEACIRSILEYGSPLFVNLQSNQSSLLDKVQSRSHKIICGLSCKCSSMVPLSYRRTMCGYKLFKRVTSDPYHSLHHIILPILPNSGKFRLPTVSNSIQQHSFVITMSKLSNTGF